MQQKRAPLELAVAIADRFMRIYPEPPTYMYHLGLSSLLNLWQATNDQRYLDFYLAYHEKKRGPRRPRFDWRLYEVTNDRKWVQDAEEVGKQFLADPHRDREGCLLDPRGRYTVDVLSHYLAHPIALGHVLQDHRYFDDALKHYELHKGYLEDPETGLWYSRWGHSLHPNRPNPGLWSRGNGWLVNAWGRTMHLWDPKHHAYQHMLDEWQRYCRAIAVFQAPSGLYRQLLNREDCFEEATGSGLFCSGFSEGVRHGTLPPEFGMIAYRTFCGLRKLVDDDGNIHNVSTYAGGYNFERQYYSCARFNEPHGDGSVMGALVAVHLLLEGGLVPDKTEPVQKPRIITDAVPNLLSSEPPEKRAPDGIAPPALKRVLALEELPEHDLFASTILGLLHWYDYTRDAAALTHASTLLQRSGATLDPAACWRVTAEVDARTKEGSIVKDLRLFVDARLGCAARDRNGVMLDEVGGYSIDQLYVWLPLLAKTAALSGDGRYLDEACAQLFGHQQWLEDPLTRLWHSAWGRGQHPRRTTPGLWGLGNGYALTSMVQLLEHLPREHSQYADVIHLLRNHVAAIHEYLPVSGGWLQLMDRLRSFACTAATGLLTYASAKALLRGWAQPAYYPVASGGVHTLGELVDLGGNTKSCSLPRGGLDTLEAYQTHRIENDASSLGFVLSACAYAAMCMRASIDPDRDGTLGAR